MNTLQPIKSPAYHHGTAPHSDREPGLADIVAEGERLLARLADTAIEDMRVRYELGRLVHKIRFDSTRRDPSWANRLARSLDMDASRLRRYARVTETIGADEFAGLVVRRDNRGRPLTWSHIELLAQIRAASERIRSSEDALAQGLSVRALAARMRSVTHRSGAVRQSPDQMQDASVVLIPK